MAKTSWQRVYTFSIILLSDLGGTYCVAAGSLISTGQESGSGGNDRTTGDRDRVTCNESW